MAKGFVHARPTARRPSRLGLPAPRQRAAGNPANRTAGLLRDDLAHSRLAAGAFRVRDFISRRFNVANIHGFTPRSPECVPKVGERLDFFTVEGISDQQLVLTSRDTHLAVMVCMDSTAERDKGQRLTVTTSVQCFNAFGRLYMLPVGLAHGPIVRRMLANIR